MVIFSVSIDTALEKAQDFRHISIPGGAVQGLRSKQGIGAA